MRSTRPVLFSFRILLSVLCLALAVIFGITKVHEAALAASSSQESNPAEPTPALSPRDVPCIQCHSQPDLTMTLENGDTLELTVMAADYAASIHGEEGYACVQCHKQVGYYPHPAWNPASRRDATLELNAVCARCHPTQTDLAMDSVHATALAAGNKNAAVCTDCHTAHQIQALRDPQTGELKAEAHGLIPQMCAQCHYAIYEKYQSSVHGAALLNENNPDVPTCIDCHGVHNIEDPRTASFRLNSPQICAKCHTDEKIMAKYGLSTDVLSTYVADFHGTTVSVFEKQSPDAEVNKAVCYDCHGIHDIARVDDPVAGIQIKENLLVRCKACHPDATANFPSAWLSHYTPSPENNRLVYFVEIFYKFFIPAVLGGMGVLVALDVGHTLVRKYQKRKLAPPSAPLEQPPLEESQNG